ncbi:MAG: hypothetical protein IJ391_03240 [Clostridia bacterium]|nr:hypothetical protein [Clostridia bacterium]
MGLFYRLRVKEFIGIILFIVFVIFAVIVFKDNGDEHYTKKIKSLKPGESITVSEIFDFEFDRAYVFDEPYIPGEHLAEIYNLDISIDEGKVDSVTDNCGRIVFVDKNGEYIYHYVYFKNDILLQERVVLFPSTIIQANIDTSCGRYTLEFVEAIEF